ncbi:MAG: hypothetical protein LBF01_03920, partial [Bacteroidales bacterium]|nr:hypothetical protein [Bacteroidales bacterium]
MKRVQVLVSLFEHYKKLLKHCIDSEYEEWVSIEPPKEAAFGDFSTNFAMIMAKKLGSNPLELAQKIRDKLAENSHFEQIEVKNPGFINWRVPKHVFIDHVPHMLSKDFGRSDLGGGRSVNVEYVSANP